MFLIFVENIDMESLDKKKKRLQFLKELRSRGVEYPDQIERTERDIAMIELAIQLEKKREDRDSKIDGIIGQPPL